MGRCVRTARFELCVSSFNFKDGLTRAEYVWHGPHDDGPLGARDVPSSSSGMSLAGVVADDGPVDEDQTLVGNGGRFSVIATHISSADVRLHEVWLATLEGEAKTWGSHVGCDLVVYRRRRHVVLSCWLVVAAPSSRLHHIGIYWIFASGTS